MNMPHEDEDEEKESSLLMAVAHEHESVLLQGLSGSHIDDMWCLGTEQAAI